MLIDRGKKWASRDIRQEELIKRIKAIVYYFCNSYVLRILYYKFILFCKLTLYSKGIIINKSCIFGCVCVIYTLCKFMFYYTQAFSAKYILGIIKKREILRNYCV